MNPPTPVGRRYLAYCTNCGTATTHKITRSLILEYVVRCESCKATGYTWKTGVDRMLAQVDPSCSRCNRGVE